MFKVEKTPQGLLFGALAVAIGFVVFKLVSKMLLGNIGSTESYASAKGFGGAQRYYGCLCDDGTTVSGCSRPDKCDECCKISGHPNARSQNQTIGNANFFKA